MSDSCVVEVVAILKTAGRSDLAEEVVRLERDRDKFHDLLVEVEFAVADFRKLPPIKRPRRKA